MSKEQPTPKTIGPRRLNHLTDSDLVQLARQGYDKAIDLLIQRHKGLLHSLCLKYRISGCEYSDLVQIGITGFLVAIQKYDPSMGWKFVTLLHFCILSRLNHAYKASIQRNRNPGSSELSLDALCEEDATLLDFQIDPTPQPDRVVLKRDEVERVLSQIYNQIQHPLTSRVLNGLSQGEGFTEIGRDVGLSRQAIEQLVQRMRRVSKSEIDLNKQGEIE